MKQIYTLALLGLLFLISSNSYLSATHIDVARDELPAGVYLFEVRGAASYMGKLMIR